MRVVEEEAQEDSRVMPSVSPMHAYAGAREGEARRRVQAPEKVSEELNGVGE